MATEKITFPPKRSQWTDEEAVYDLRGTLGFQ